MHLFHECRGFYSSRTVLVDNGIKIICVSSLRYCVQGLYYFIEKCFPGSFVHQNNRSAAHPKDRLAVRPSSYLSYGLSLVLSSRLYWSYPLPYHPGSLCRRIQSIGLQGRSMGRHCRGIVGRHFVSSV